MPSTELLRKLRASLHKRWFTAVAQRADDVTERSAGASCIVFAPHPDDETLGCGATIHRKREVGTSVHVVIASDGRRSQEPDVIAPEELVRIRAREALDACTTLGVAAEHVHQL